MRDLVAAAKASGGEVAFTLAAGANRFLPLLRDDTVHAWVCGDIVAVAQAADLTPVRRGANVILLPARDAGVLYLPENARQRLRLQGDDDPLPVSPVQLYLDMRAAGGRYAEQGIRLRDEVLGYQQGFERARTLLRARLRDSSKLDAPHWSSE
jgi:hypothetical protein